jgi:8-oxo-dGTP diphosphatase
MATESLYYFQVTAALIPAQGRIFIAQRPPHKKFGLLWEFPGGKVERGESLEESLIREIREELCWDIQVGELFKRIHTGQYDMVIDLYAFWCTIQGGSLCLREHVAYYWAHTSELQHFGFTRADDQLVLFLEQLAELPKGNLVVTSSWTPSRPS